MDTIALGRMFDVSLGLRYDWIDAKSSSRPPAARAWMSTAPIASSARASA